MKKLIRLVLVLSLLSVAALAQNNAYQQTTFTSATSGASIPEYSGVGYHKITWAPTAMTVCTVALDSSPDGVTWTPGGIISGQTCTSSGSIAVIATAQYVRVTVTAFTGTSLLVTYTGSSSAPTGTNSNQVQGTAATGASPVGNPVYLGGLNPNNTAILPLAMLPGNQDANFAGGGTGGFVGMELYNGSTEDRAFYCPNTSTFSVASTVTQVVGLSGSTKIRVCSVSLNPSTITAGSVDLVYGTGTACATGIATLTGAFTLPASAVVSISPMISAQGPLITPAGQAVCVRTVTATVNGFITWTQY